MSECIGTGQHTNTGQEDNVQEDNVHKDTAGARRGGGVSASLLITGFVALIISIWGLAGGATIGGAVSLGWVLVIGAIVVGLLLVIAPRRKR